MIVVGKNNAGKSTIVEALRLVSLITNRYQRLEFHRVPRWLDRPRSERGVSPSLQNIELNLESAFHQYSDPPAIITCTFASNETITIYIGKDAQLHAVTRFTARDIGPFIRSPVVLWSCSPSIVTLEQGTEAWREWRHKGIGASDASTIMGENRFKSAGELLKEKRGPALDFGQNAAMARGTELEPEARRRYIAKTGRDVRPACLQSARYDWLRASLDGLAINYDAVVEIKCGQSAYRTAAQTRAVPVYYYGQMQHILAVTGLESLDFFCYWPGCPELLIPVPRNAAYIERLLIKELEFWSHIQR